MEATNIAYKSWKQADDISGLLQSQRVAHITPSHFGEVCKCADEKKESRYKSNEILT